MGYTFEALPDEIIMLIVKYSGDVFAIFRAYAGLNRRLNAILLDRRLHLLADYLGVAARHRQFDDDYDSPALRPDALKRQVTDDELRQWLQPLIIAHINKKYERMQRQFHSDRESINAIRQRLPREQLRDADDALATLFANLEHHPCSQKVLKQVESLIRENGARLICDDYQYGPFNLARALNRRLFLHVNNARPINRSDAARLAQLFKLLILSNPALLFNRDDMGGGGCPVHYFLFLAIYPLECINYRTSHSPHDIPVNINVYRAVLDLALFVIQCQKQLRYETAWSDEVIFDILSALTNPEKMIAADELFIQTSRAHVLTLLANESAVERRVNDYVLTYTLPCMLRNLIKRSQAAMILFIWERCAQANVEENAQLIDMMTGGRSARELFHTLMARKMFPTWFTDGRLMFTLLKKKERKLLERLLTASPSLINQVDDDANNPLVYACVKVRGCRQRIVEFLVRMGCNRGQPNAKGQNFMQAVQLDQNRRILEHLIEQELLDPNDLQHHVF